MVNTSDAKSPGEHWCSIYIPKKYNQNIEYFDSFGLPAINKHFLKFINNNCKQYVYNPLQIQSDISTVCGEFCVVFLHQRCVEKKTLEQFINQFDRNKLEMNDAKVVTMYNKVHKQKKNTRAKKKMTQFGYGSNDNNIICNQTCVARHQQTKKKKRKKSGNAL